MSSTPHDILREAGDPQTPAARLAEIAAQYPEAHAVVASNPSCYPGLLEWLSRAGDAATRQIAASRLAGAGSGSGAGVSAAAQPAQGQSAHAQPAPAYPAPETQAPQYPVSETQAPQNQAPQYQAPQPEAQQPQSPQYSGSENQTQQYPTQAYPTQQYPNQQYPTQAYPAQQGQFAPTDYSAQPGQGGYGQPPASANGFAADGTPVAPKKRRRGIVIGVIAGALVLVLGGGTLAWALFFSKLGGAATPEAAADKLVTALTDVDVVSLYGSLAPSEIEAIRPSLERLANIRVDGDSSDDLDAVVQPALDSLDVSTEGFEYETDSIADDVEVVRLVEGSLTIDGDPAKIADAITAITRSQYETTGQSTSSLDRQRDKLESNLEEQLPYTITAGDMKDELGFDARLVTVKEGNSWYVSPVLTAGEYMFQADGNADYGDVPSGDELAQYSTPEDAADGLTNELFAAIDDGKSEGLAASLPLVERRFVGLYGGVMFPKPAELDLEITPGFEAETKGDTARLQFSDFTMKMTFLRTTMKYTIDGVCATVETGSSETTGCLDDLDEAKLDKLDVTEWRIIAVRQDGGWFVSPISTVADVSSIVTKRLVELSESGDLDSIFG